MLRLALILLASLQGAPGDSLVRGSVVDAETGAPLPCRVAIRGENGTYYAARSASPEGSALPYRKERAGSLESHVTLSAHPFTAELPAGTYAVTVERGKEYVPETRQVVVPGLQPVEIQFKLRRWIDLASRRWYSGETHVHRPVAELGNLQLAEDLNVAFPFSSWVLESGTPPKSDRSEAKVTQIDPTHVYFPCNTEYEIFRVGKKSHTLGAIFILNHQTVFEEGVPPLGPVVAKARKQGALLELDKHNWPWTAMIAPVCRVDLYELANNHMWETDFAFRDFGLPAPEYMRIEKDSKGMTERGWIDYTFQNYYAFLDCGLRMRPTAGSASGVHPVPLGFGRVYVHLPEGFRYEAWVKGLEEGRSFVTTGPMLFASLSAEGVLAGRAESAVPLSTLEIVQNGEVARLVKPDNRPSGKGGFVSEFRQALSFEGSSWVAVRCFEERADRRVRFAHTAPVWVEVAGKPLRPRGVEVDFLKKRVEAELVRNAGILPEPALDEYREALKFYEEKRAQAR